MAEKAFLEITWHNKRERKTTIKMRMRKRPFGIWPCHNYNPNYSSTRATVLISTST
jgi:hypothetical protein